jgi:hypothetical protein
MKKIIPFLLSFMAACCFAQQYVPFPTSNAVWRENGVNHSSGIPGTYEHSFYEIKITGDTIINNLTYHALESSGFGQAWYNFIGPYPAGVPGEVCCGGIREDSMKRIYYYDYALGMEYLLYDFNLNLGDTLPSTMMCYSDRNVIVGIDSINVNGTFHKRYQIADTSYLTLPFGYYIEGIGSTMGLTGGQLHMTEMPFEVYSWLICYAINGTTTLIDGIFTNYQYDCDLLNDIRNNNISSPQSITIFPNPARDQFSVASIQQSISSIKVFDILGNEIYSSAFNSTSCIVHCESFPPGIYFVRLFAGKEFLSSKLIKQ